MATTAFAGMNVADTRLHVCIAAHFVPERRSYLQTVLDGLLEIKAASITITLMTNGAEGAAGLADLSREQERVRIEVLAVSGLAHPFNLPWAHKPLIVSAFKAGATHFLYLEDDMAFGAANFDYFLRWRDPLKARDLIPSYLRTEITADGQLVSTDNIRPIETSRRPNIAVSEALFVVPNNPYSALFLLDDALAKEHIASPAFDINKSKKITSWDVRERAAMGPCFKKSLWAQAPRFAIGLEQVSLRPIDGVTVRHLPNNYALNPDTDFGSIPIENLFAR